MKFIFVLLAICAAPVMAGKNTTTTDGDYKMFEDAFCRTDDHKRGSDGHEFYKRDDDKAACQAYCDDEDWCSGYEYGSGNKCEIWREKSHEFKTKNADSDSGSSCNWKKKQPNDSHSDDYYYNEVHEDDSEDGDYYYEEHEEDSEDYEDYYYEEKKEDSEDSEDYEDYYYEEKKEDSEDYYYDSHSEDYYY